MLTELQMWMWDANLFAAAVLGLAWVLSHALHGQRASVRHHVWTISLAIVLLSPAVRPVVPQVDVRVLQTSLRMTALLTRAEEAVSEVTAPTTRGASITQAAGRPRWPIILGVVIWLAGAAGLLFVRLWRRLRLADLCAKARPWHMPGCVGVHEDVIVPMLAGLRRPMILLPASAIDWPSPELEAILLHERAHLARRDHLIAVMADVATTAYWLNPLVWVAALSLERERERACDDEVLQAGVKPSVYTAALLRVAARLHRPMRTEGALTMPGAGLDARVRHLLANRTHHSGRVPLSWPRTAALIIVCTLAAATAHLVGQEPTIPAGDVLAVVNGEALATVELSRHHNDGSQPRPHTITDARFPQWLLDVVDDMLVVQRGKELGYALSDDQFTSVLENIKTRNELQNDEQLLASLTREHLTLADLRQSLERQMIVSRVQFLQLSTGVRVTDEDARQYYAVHSDEFSRARFEQVRDQVTERVAALNRRRAWEAYLNTLRSQAAIEWKTADMKRLYDVGLAERASAPK